MITMCRSSATRSLRASAILRSIKRYSIGSLSRTVDAVLDSMHRPLAMEERDRRNIQALDMLMSTLLALVRTRRRKFAR